MLTENDRKTIIARLRSWPVWVAVIGQIVTIIALKDPEIADTFKVIAVALGNIALAFGILNNPADSKNF